MPFTLVESRQKGETYTKRYEKVFEQLRIIRCAMCFSKLFIFQTFQHSSTFLFPSIAPRNKEMKKHFPFPSALHVQPAHCPCLVLFWRRKNAFLLWLTKSSFSFNGRFSFSFRNFHWNNDEKKSLILKFWYHHRQGSYIATLQQIDFSSQQQKSGNSL